MLEVQIAERRRECRQEECGAPQLLVELSFGLGYVEVKTLTVRRDGARSAIVACLLVLV